MPYFDEIRNERFIETLRLMTITHTRDLYNKHG